MNRGLTLRIGAYLQFYSLTLIRDSRYTFMTIKIANLARISSIYINGPNR
nr:MAG TPA: hypothetical protein [Caudoviricetes sp.]